MLLPHHIKELNASGIAEEVIAARGYRSVTANEVKAAGFADSQCRPGLLIPQWTLAGVQRGNMIKPDNPRTDKNGRILKYEAPFGSKPRLDIHPNAQHVLRDASIPLSFTEGNKKADAAWTWGIPCVSVTGVWLFMRRRLILTDLDEIALNGRNTRVLFDSDVTRKQAVEEALLRLCASLDRRGANVEVVYLPEGRDGAKVGLDDWLMMGGDPEALPTLAQPWHADNGPGIWWNPRDPEEHSLSTALINLIRHPAYSHAELKVLANMAIEAHARMVEGKADAKGSVVLNAYTLSNDHRSNGNSNGSYNNDGTKPYVARERVKTIMDAARATGAIEISPHPVQRSRQNGTHYEDTEYVITPKPTLVETLNAFVQYMPQELKQRKPRTVPARCPHCGEVHKLNRMDFCDQCGAKVGEEFGIVPPRVVEENPADLTTQTPLLVMSDDLSENQSIH